jgi:hypothetical protein
VPVSATATRRVFSGSKCSAFGGSARDCVAWRVRVSLVPGGSFPDRAVRVQVSRSVNAGNLLGFVGRILNEAWTAGAKSLAPSSAGGETLFFPTGTDAAVPPDRQRRRGACCCLVWWAAGFRLSS